VHRDPPCGLPGGAAQAQTSGFFETKGIGRWEHRGVVGGSHERVGGLELSYRSRERKRKARAAINRDQAQAHKSGSSADGWYLTLVSKPCSCNNPDCARHMRPSGKDPREIVYRREPRTIYCVDCAQKLGLWPEVRLSRRWKDKHAVKVKGGAAWMREREAAGWRACSTRWRVRTA